VTQFTKRLKHAKSTISLLGIKTYFYLFTISVHSWRAKYGLQACVPGGNRVFVGEFKLFTFFLGITALQ